ncbi:MAG: hypothetical protein J6Z09_04780 [Lachnospiraceae bacterium]|nr:hypothetical protein [Lachnospiraceae bacterium]
MMARRRRRGFGSVIAVFVIMLLLMSVMIFFFLTKEERLAKQSKWVRQVDLTESVTEGIEDYIRLARLGDEIDVKNLVPSVKYNVILTFKSKGEFDEALDKASFEECESLAYKAFEEAVTMLVKNRLEASGRTGDPSELISETLGCDLISYLKENAPAILPSYDELNSTTEKSAKAETYLCNGNTLVIVESGADPVLYEKWEGETNE